MAVDYEALARRYGFSRGAVETLARALIQGRGKAAQFNHPELGGMGQWMPGMVMIGDAFNQTLKDKVARLCTELVGLVGDDIAAASAQERWWPAAWGQPSMSGQQNTMRYAYFEKLHRLAVMRHNTLHVYRTEGYRITGVAQAQMNSSALLVFQTDSGVVSERDLEEVDNP